MLTFQKTVRKKIHFFNLLQDTCKIGLGLVFDAWLYSNKIFYYHTTVVHNYFDHKFFILEPCSETAICYNCEKVFSK